MPWLGFFFFEQIAWVGMLARENHPRLRQVCFV